MLAGVRSLTKIVQNCNKMYDSGLIPCKYDDPDRCTQEVSGRVGACFFKVEPGSTKCKMHGAQIRHIQDKNEIRAYRVAQWESRLKDFADNPNIKTLRDEIGIARLTLEAILNRCRTPGELFLYSNKISEMLVRVQNLVIACNRLEDRLGYTLDKSAVVNIGEQIINVIALHLPEETLAEVSEQIADVIIETMPTRK